MQYNNLQLLLQTSPESSSPPTVCPILFITVQALHTSAAYKFYVESIIIPNAAYCFLIAYTMIHSLYFRNICKPMCLKMKQLIRMTCSSCIRCCHRKPVMYTAGFSTKRISRDKHNSPSRGIYITIYCNYCDFL